MKMLNFHANLIKNLSISMKLNKTMDLWGLD